MDELMKGVKIGKLIGKDEKKETCKIVAVVLGVIAAIAAVAAVISVTVIRRKNK